MTIMIFLFTQKAAYDMRISDWSSDVCSSDLFAPVGQIEGFAPGITIGPLGNAHIGQIVDPQFGEHRRYRRYLPLADRKRVVQGKSVSGRLDLGGRRIDK